ncbi:hypothetical protein BKA62DRAFT_693443 [Auriculariales sp. MPI-PUGE-AT-0066]|nr:hypothetical protein BKA62DRAFT_693443 [Auriculariales sp. MPI-PUGE-AT-0066]
MATTTRVNLAHVLRLSHPHVELRLDTYHRQTDQFLKNLREKTDEVKSHLAATREEHAQETRRTVDKAKETEAQTKKFQEQARAVLSAVEGETAQRKQAETGVAELRRALNALKSKTSTYDKQIDQKNASIDTVSSDQDGDRELLDRRAEDCVPDLLQLQHELQLGIEGINANLLEFKFPIHGRGPGSLVLDHSSRLYKVAQCEPGLGNLGELLDELNASRELYLFLVRVQESFNSSGE